MGAIGFGPGLSVRREGRAAAVLLPAPVFDFAGGALPAGATLSRASAGTRFNAAGALVSVGTDGARFDHDPATLALRGLLIEPSATNRHGNHNAAPTALTGVTLAGDAAATLAVADDAAALAAAGLGIGNGAAFRLDNGAGSVAAQAVFAGVSGKPNTQTCSVYVRGGSGRIDQASAGPAFAASGGYVRRVLTFAAGTGVGCALTALPGQMLYFLLNQYEQAGAASSPIVVAGAAESRAADVLTLDWASRWVGDGAVTLRCTFDDLTTQDVAATITGGAMTVPTPLNRAWLRRIEKL